MLWNRTSKSVNIYNSELFNMVFTFFPHSIWSADHLQLKRICDFLLIFRVNKKTIRKYCKLITEVINSSFRSTTTAGVVMCLDSILWGAVNDRCRPIKLVVQAFVKSSAVPIALGCAAAKSLTIKRFTDHFYRTSNTSSSIANL